MEGGKCACAVISSALSFWINFLDPPLFEGVLEKPVSISLISFALYMQTDHFM